MTPPRPPDMPDASASITIRREPPRQDDVRELLAQSDAYMAERYPEESNHLMDVAALEAEHVTFFVARAGGMALGCGALVRHDTQVVEIKRLFVTSAARGLRAGRRLLEALEQHAHDSGASLVRLETGIHQPEALALYANAGYERRGPFGHYADDPYSVFMEKRLQR